MTKSYIFLALILGLVFAQTCSAGPARISLSPREIDSDDEDADEDADSEDADSEDEDDDDLEDEDDEEEEEEEEESNPAPSCLLFGDQACHIECTVIAQAYSITADGHCDENQTCQCHITGKVSFQKAWKNKFDSDYVYKKIKENDLVLEQAHRIFNYPLRTAEEFKNLFKPILSPYQFTKLETHDDSKAAEFTKNGEDKIDQKAVEQYVAKEVKSLLESSAKSLLTTKYQDKFREALNESEGNEGTLHNFTFRVRQLKNKTLENILKEYLKKNGKDEPKVESIEKEGLSEILTNAVINEIIKKNDEKNRPPPKKTAPAKKGAAGKKPATGKKAAAPTDKKPAAVKKPAGNKKP
ncbi:trigger factor-like isoform X2 [Planococcus citri]|uniref:trigger factor-like isoform X2 n=1 Tax=Planococcus citri TaxID=170843 RepID=UPI0031F88E86